MTESAYARDLRVVWWPNPQCYTVATGDDPPPAVYLDTPDPERPDVWLWVARLDARPIENVPDSANPDEVFYALIGEPENLDDMTLLVWAVRYRGWLSTSFVEEVHDGPDAMGRLIEQGLFEQARDQEPVFRLTEAGAAKAAMLAAED